jgi:hypothetical protein
MSYLNQIALAGGTLACAVGIGFVMQSSETAQQRYGGSSAVPEIEVKPIQAELGVKLPKLDDSLLDIQSIALTSALPEGIVGLGQSLSLDAPPVDCEITASAQVLAAAMVDISLRAPCLGNERVTIHHSGMMFTETTAVDGSLNVTVPALNPNAFFMLAFSEGDGTSVQVDIDGLEFYDRVVVQWKGDLGFELHAREYGAEYGSTGHVWQDAARDLSVAAKGEGGFLTVLGDRNAPEPLLAQVYTFPTGTARENGVVSLSVESAVTKINCGRDIQAQSLEMRDAGQLKSQNLSLSVPGCDAVGDFLVLNNLLEDLKVARN